MLKAGATSLDITPAPGESIPGQWLTRTALTVLDPLSVNTVVIENDACRAAIVSCDALSLKNRVVAAARARIEAAAGIPPERLILHATHTHSGPPVVEALGTAEDEAWIARLTDTIVESVERAASRLRPALMSWVHLPAPGHAFPRRFHMADGTVLMHPAKGDPAIVRPEGVTDDVLTAFGLFDEQDNAIAVAISFACHPICVGGATAYSGDYPGAACRAARGIWGEQAVGLYLNGFCGDNGPDNLADRDQSGYGEAGARRLGIALASSASAELVRAPRVGSAPLSGSIAHVKLAIRRPDPKSVETARAALGEDLSPIPQDVERIKQRELLLLERETGASPFVDAEITALRLGPGLLVGWPGEVFSAYGRRLRELAPSEFVMPIGLCSGCHGYIPTPEAFLGGGYETWLVRSSKLEVSAGDKLLLATRDLLLE